MDKFMAGLIVIAIVLVVGFALLAFFKPSLLDVAKQEVNKLIDIIKQAVAINPTNNVEDLKALVFG